MRRRSFMFKHRIRKMAVGVRVKYMRTSDGSTMHVRLINSTGRTVKKGQSLMVDETTDRGHGLFIHAVRFRRAALPSRRMIAQEGAAPGKIVMCEVLHSSMASAAEFFGGRAIGAGYRP